MKNIVLVTALTFATFSVMAAPLPDASKLPPASTQQGVTYEKDIHPIFDELCLRCHGEQRPRGNVRLDSLEQTLKSATKEGKVVVAGDSAKSKLLFDVASIDGRVSMPPKPRPGRGGPGGPGMGGPGGPGMGGPGGPAAAPEAGTNGAPAAPAPKPWKGLTTEQVGLVRAWIDQGAK